MAVKLLPAVSFLPPTWCRPKRANTPGTTYLRLPKTSGSRCRSNSEPPSPNRQQYFPESSASSSTCSEDGGEHETTNGGAGASVNVWERVDDVRALKKGLERHFKYRMEMARRKHGPEACSQVPDKMEASLLKLRNKGVSGPTVPEELNPEGLEPYPPAPRPLGFAAETKHSLEGLKLGIIIFTTWSPRRTTKPQNAHEAQNPSGETVTKDRPVVVVELRPNKAICVPMFSHNGKGIKHKSKKERTKYVAVQNKDEERWPVDNEYPPLKATPDPSVTVPFPKVNSYLKFTEPEPYPSSMAYTVMGWLEGASTERLLNLVVWSPNSRVLA